MNKKEVLRYLKYGKTQPTPQVMELIDQCIADCEAEIVPRCVYRTAPCHISGNDCHIGNMTLTSKFLAKNLGGCMQVVVFAATLGAHADLMIRKSSISDMARAAVLQSVFATQIEEYIDKMEVAICIQCGCEKLRPRFSPGYADLPLERQTDLFAFLDISKRIGVTLTDSFLMTPTKSVTALIGVPPQKQ